MKYIIELEKIEGTDLYRAVGANTLVFDERGIKNILKPLHRPEDETDWSKVPVDTPILVKEFEDDEWEYKHFAKYKNNMVYAWVCGKSSFTARNYECVSWKYAKLVEELK